mmetsp:Transcript_27523/g.33601  ORF Transcript_27523/g.33601 Transcript_27523/m.33601 type:complete len:183 (+) Transcript_27523:140-688(+)
MLSRLTNFTIMKSFGLNYTINVSKRLFSVDKGEYRVEGRLDGLLMTDEEIDEAMKTHYDEEGSYKPPDASHFPSFSRRDCMMNVRIPPLGIEPPPFGEEQIREITEKTTITRENIEWARSEWTDTTRKPDEKKYKVLKDDILEMYKKGVSYATINLWLDYMSGADIGYKDAIYNRTWARIDS